MLLLVLTLVASLLPMVAATPARAAAPGDLVITEVMQNPASVADAGGEWFEVHNPTGTDIDLAGWTIADAGTDSHVISISVVVPAGGFAVLGNNADTVINGGVAVDYTFPGTFFLGNADDELILSDPALVVIDEIAWDGGPVWPDPTGASMSLDPAAANSTDNDDGANWCQAISPYGAGDLGTPGAANDECDEDPPPPPDPAAVLVINEVMQNPDAVLDASGEWFEIYNPNDTAVDIDGWTISDRGADSHVIDNGGPLLVPADGYLVLGNNTDTGSNGGVTVDYGFPGTFFLGNADDELVLMDTTSAEVDHVEWDGGPSWPDPTGASMTLSDPSADNNEPANWCEASTAYGAGDLGTPGGANDSCEPPPPPPPSDPIPIAEVQGAGHISPYNNVSVTTTGVVTAIAFDGFYIQDPVGDGDDATSEALVVFMGSGFANAPTVAVGDAIELTDTVTEFIPGGAATGNLSTTQMSFPTITILSTGNAVPEPAIIGKGGRVPPAVHVISDDELPVNLQTATGVFNPEEDGIDFYESLEGMLVEIDDPHVVGATRTFGTFSSEMFTVPSGGKTVAPRDALTRRGALELQPDLDNYGDQNPERVQIQFDASIGNPGTLYPGEAPGFKVGSRLNDVVGVVGYDFGNFEVRATELVTGKQSRLEPEESRLRNGRFWLTVASYNVLNLSPGPEDDAQRAELADQIVGSLNSPDVLALQEVQDNTGETNDGTTAADLTLQALIDAVVDAGGPEYAFVDNPPLDNAEGGVPGGNIRNAFLYNPDRVDLIDTMPLNPTVLSIAGVTDPTIFEGTRSPLLGLFAFNGQEFYVIGNHLSSRSGSTPIFGAIHPFVQAAEDEREGAAAALNEFVDFLIGQNDDANVIVAGDMNTFQWTDDLSQILPGTGKDRVLTNLVSGKKYLTDDRDDVYTYIFEGNAQVLDHMFVTDDLKKSASADIVHVNVDFPVVSGEVTGSDHEPVLARFRVMPAHTPLFFDLQVLHASDLEGGVDALDRAPNFAAIVDKLEDNRHVDGSITLSAGDNYIPGPFFNAAGDASFRQVFNDVYNALYGLESEQYADLRELGGRVDVSIMNVIGFDASAVGNHEFDLGSDIFENIIEESFGAAPTLADDQWVGAQFPYLSSNLDFSGDADLGNLFTSALLANTAFETGPFESAAGLANTPKLAPVTYIDVGQGQRVGVVGATTQLLQTISSPSGTTVVGPGIEDMTQLASLIQPQVDRLTAIGIDKIVLVSHLQQISLEEELVTLLNGVDIVIAGGSDSLLANPDDDLRDGDVADEQYPLITEGSDGDPAVIVSTDGEYSYVGQLVVRFNRHGKLVNRWGWGLNGLEDLNLSMNGPVKTETEDVAELWRKGDPFAEGTKGDLVADLVTAAEAVVIAKDGNIVGETTVFIEGRREKVRTEETNLGNLTADANLNVAQSFDPTTAVSIKNGGGIRAEIGEIGDGGVLLPPQANPLSGKLAGQVSQLDVENSLRFNNELSLVTVTAVGLKAIVEHAVAATGPGATPGQFPQIGGMAFSFEPGNPAGSRVQSLAIVDGAGTVVDTVVAGGSVAGDPGRLIRVVTLSFLVDGGDSYPFPAQMIAGSRVDLPDVLTDSGAFTFAAPGSEQDALSEYLFGLAAPFSSAETPPPDDLRLQNLDFRSDTVLP
jgi:predicted extracellular nuclease/2',3'-cyclic-nucleotide 2'-phosphodiesterase (5'-nucleotidase family)